MPLTAEELKRFCNKREANCTNCPLWVCLCGLEPREWSINEIHRILEESYVEDRGDVAGWIKVEMDKMNAKLALVSEDFRTAYMDKLSEEEREDCLSFSYELALEALEAFATDQYRDKSRGGGKEE